MSLPFAVAATEYEDHVKALGCLRDLEQPLKEARSKVSPVLILGASSGWLCLCFANAPTRQGRSLLSI